MSSKEDQLAMKKAEYEGKVFKTKNYGDVVVLEYRNARDVLIKFVNTGNTRTVGTSELKKGEIRDNELKPVYKVGTMDMPNTLTRRDKAPKEYRRWSGMLQRCYNENLRHKHTTYKDCTVSENFKVYSYFYEWCNNQIGFDKEQWHLDKDILIKGNKLYSEDTCCFVPSEINGLFTKANNIRGKYPIGVYHDTSKCIKRFSARVSKNGKYRRFGSYKTPEEAFEVYKREKEKYIKEVAEKWKDQIDIKVYDALMNWTVEITD